MSNICCDLQIPRTRPVISQWTTDKMKYRENYEKENYEEFGTGGLNEPISYIRFSREVNFLLK